MFPVTKGRTRSSLLAPFTMTSYDKRSCRYVSNFVVFECIAVIAGGYTVFSCVWSPEQSTNDYNKLIRIMYLYDSDACGYKFAPTKKLANLHLSNDTHGMNVLPIKWLPALTSVSARLTARTRNYIMRSIGFHVIWCILAIGFRIVIVYSTDLRTLKFALAVFFYSCVFIMCFDSTMAIVYITHIKQSLTNGMVLRYSGWSTELKLKSYDDFAAWLPIAASACWLRGVVFYILNLYFCRVLLKISQRTYRREIFKNNLSILSSDNYHPIPEAKLIQTANTNVLVYRIGEAKPHVSGIFT